MTERTQDEIMGQEGYLHCSLAAVAACVHVTTIYRLIDQEVLPGRTLGARRYVERKALAEYYSDSDTIRKRILKA